MQCIKVVAGIIQNGRGEILIARRKEGKHLAGYWEFPGGKIESGESPEACLVREINEELNIQIKVGEPLGDSMYNYEEKSILLKGYKAQYVDGDFVLTDHDVTKWVLPDHLRNYKLAPADVPFLDMI